MTTNVPRRDAIRVQGALNADRWVDRTRYRMYRDVTLFEYRVTLERGPPDIDDDGNVTNEGERYVLHLFESLDKPHPYNGAPLAIAAAAAARNHAGPIDTAAGRGNPVHPSNRSQ